MTESVDGLLDFSELFEGLRAESLEQTLHVLDQSETEVFLSDRFKEGCMVPHAGRSNQVLVVVLISFLLVFRELGVLSMGPSNISQALQLAVQYLHLRDVQLLEESPKQLEGHFLELSFVEVVVDEVEHAGTHNFSEEARVLFRVELGCTADGSQEQGVALSGTLLQKSEFGFIVDLTQVGVEEDGSYEATAETSEVFDFDASLLPS